MRHFTLFILASCLCLCLSKPAQAQTPTDPQMLLRQVGETYRKLQHYQFEFVISNESNYTGNGLESSSKGQEFFAISVSQPNRFRIETKSTNSNVLAVGDGHTTWFFTPTLNLYTKNEITLETLLDPTKRGLTVFDSMVKRPGGKLAQYRTLGTNKMPVKLLREESVEIGGNKILCYVLETGLSQGTTKQSTTYWIDKTRLLILREVNQFNLKTPTASTTNTMQVTTFKLVRVNEALPESLFAFPPPREAVETDKLDYDRVPRFRPAMSLVGQPAPAFDLPDLQGRNVSLQSLRGKVVLLNFWATWCGPCVVEMPHMEKLQQEFAERNVVVLGVDDESAATAAEFMVRRNYTYNSLVDEARKVSQLYQISSIPQSFFITADGRIGAQLSGTQTEAQLRATLEQTLRGEVSSPKPVVDVAAREAARKLAAYQPLLGNWRNAETRGGLVKLRIQQKQGYLWVQAWGQCAPEPCDWGKVPVEVYQSSISAAADETPHVLSANFNTNFSQKQVLIFPDREDRLRVEVLDRFTDRSGRSNYRFVETLVKDGSSVVRPEPIATTASAEPAANLPAPKLLAPAHGTVFDHYPRETVVIWEPVPLAAAYRVELDYGHAASGTWQSQRTGNPPWIFAARETRQKFNFIGAQPGRWRVWAVDAQGRAGAKSEWWEFSYTK